MQATQEGSQRSVSKLSPVQPSLDQLSSARVADPSTLEDFTLYICGLVTSIQKDYTEESYGQDVCCCWRSINQSWFDQLLLFIPSLLFWKSNLSTVLERKAKIQLSPWPPSPQESDNCLRNLRWQQQHTRPTIERDSSANGTCQLQTTTLVASSNQDKKLTNFDDSCFSFLLFIIVAQTCSRGGF